MFVTFILSFPGKWGVAEDSVITQKLVEAGALFLTFCQTSLSSRANKMFSYFEHQNLPSAEVF